MRRARISPGNSPSLVVWIMVIDWLGDAVVESGKHVSVIETGSRWEVIIHGNLVKGIDACGDMVLVDWVAIWQVFFNYFEDLDA